MAGTAIAAALPEKIIERCAGMPEECLKFSTKKENNSVLRYENKTAQQFVDELEDAGHDVEHYRGRNMWEGPAVRAQDNREFQQVIRDTSVTVQWDTLGLGGYIIYPVRHGGEPIEE